MKKNYIKFILVCLVFVNSALKAETIESCIQACDEGQLSLCIPLGSGMAAIDKFIYELKDLEVKSEVTLGCGKKISVDLNGILFSDDQDCNISDVISNQVSVFIPKKIHGKMSILNLSLKIFSFESKENPILRIYNVLDSRVLSLAIGSEKAYFFVEESNEYQCWSKRI